MAKVIWRAGKVGVEILFVLLAFGLIFYSARVFTVAEEQSIPVSGSNNTEAEALLEQVKQAIKAGQLQEAKQISDQIVQAWPGTVYAMDALGEIGYLCVLEDDDAGVANVMTQLYGNYSGQPKITIAIDRVAKGYLPKRTPAKASVIYNEALTKMPNHPKVFRLHAGIIKCQIMQEDFTQAEAGLEQLWSQYSSAEAFVQILNSIKYTYRLIHNYSAVQTLCDRILTEFPDHPLAPLALRDQINAYINLEDMSQAKNKTEELFTNYKNSSVFEDSVLSICKTFILKKDQAGALQYIDRALQLYPDNEDFTLLKDTTTAKILSAQLKEVVKSREDQEANHISDQITQILPASSYAMDALAEVGSLYARKGDDSGAADVLTQLYTQYSAQPKVIEAIDRVAHGYIRKNPTEAHLIYSDAISKMSDRPDVFWLQGGLIKCQIKQYDYVQAEAGLEQLWSQHSSKEGFVNCVNTIKNVYRDGGDYEDVLTLCDRILTEFPNHSLAPRVFKDKIRACIHLGQMPQANFKTEELLANYDQANSFEEIILSICDSYIQENDYVTALQYIDRALQSSPYHEKVVWFLKSKADCYMNMGDTPKVEAVVNEIIQNHSTKEDSAKILNEIAGGYLSKRLYGKSIELYQYVLSSNPDESEQLRAHAGIGMNYIWLGDDAKAQFKIDLILAEYKDQPKAGYSVLVIGEEYYKKAHTADGKSEAQIKDCHKKAIAIWKNNINEINDPHHKCLAYYYTGLSSQSLKDYPTSLANFQKVIGDYPDSEFAANALFMIGRVYQKNRGVRLDFNSAAAFTGVTDPNEAADMVVSLDLLEVGDPNSETAIPVGSSAVTINSTRAAFELLVERYPDSPGAGYAGQWLTKQSSN